MSKPVNEIQDPTLRTLTSELVLIVNCPSFEYGGVIPTRLTCDGENISPALEITNVPAHTRSLVLIVSDQTIESKILAHWVVWNIPPSPGRIAEGTAPGEQGTNDFDRRKYIGPCPTGTIHKYHFTVYALDVLLKLDPGSHNDVVMKALEGHVLAAGELVGVYPGAEPGLEEDE